MFSHFTHLYSNSHVANVPYNVLYKSTQAFCCLIVIITISVDLFSFPAFTATVSTFWDEEFRLQGTAPRHPFQQQIRVSRKILVYRFVLLTWWHSCLVLCSSPLWPPQASCPTSSLWHPTGQQVCRVYRCLLRTGRVWLYLQALLYRLPVCRLPASANTWDRSYCEAVSGTIACSIQSQRYYSSVSVSSGYPCSSTNTLIRTSMHCFLVSSVSAWKISGLLYFAVVVAVAMLNNENSGTQFSFDWQSLSPRLPYATKWDTGLNI